MTPSDIEAIVHGNYSDPFRLLGPHESGGQWEVRAFLPQASEAWVELNGELLAMDKLDAGGLFVRTFREKPGHYCLHLKLWTGEEIDAEDPYRFPPLLTDFDIHLHGEGTHNESFRTLGAHLATSEGTPGVRFAVWAPNAFLVSVAGDFNEWDERRHPMRRRNGGIWELFVPGLGAGATYKYVVRSKFDGFHQQKADPYGFAAEVPPKSASVVWDVESYQWSDAAWMEARARTNYLTEPVTMYEVHLGSWLRGPNNQFLTYRELAEVLVAYVKRMGYTHIELLPIMEFPFDGSWGYQVVGYYAPTSRFGTPDDFKFFIDRCHQEGIGVILDWVPAHFPRDGHGLAYFDGTALYEHADPRRGEHAEWGTKIFNYGRNEVRTFLISNALFWIEQYHLDGLRVDAVASMLFLDHGRKPGDWAPNQYGGNENLEAMDFLRRVNQLAHQHPGVLMIAEESTSFGGVSRPVHLGGIGFTMKWNMGWMHDMFDYFKQDPIYRKFHHNKITFSLMYAFSENFLLPVSHDEVVHLKKSLISKMPGDYWQKFANVRAFLAYMYGHPGKKLLFMGQEIGQWDEWYEGVSVQWELTRYDLHRLLQDYVRELNWFYRSHPALYQVDYSWEGFQWIDFSDYESSIISFIRRPRAGGPFLVFVCNFTPIVRTGYRVGVPSPGSYREVFNTDAAQFGGSNVGNGGLVEADNVSANGHFHSLVLTLPPLGVVMFESPANN